MRVREKKIEAKKTQTELLAPGGGAKKFIFHQCLTQIELRL